MPFAISIKDNTQWSDKIYNFIFWKNGLECSGVNLLRLNPVSTIS